MEFFDQAIIPKFNYWIYVILMMIGLYAMIAKNNMVKKLIGMSIFQTAIILFYVSVGVKAEASIPILHHDLMPHHVEGAHQPGGGNALPEVNPDKYANPLPHVLMLTAIVVGVSTLGLALAISQKLYREFGSLEEDEIVKQITPEKLD